ncbi:DNA repair protein RadA, partial [Kineococcus indalonis]|uniref:DNA repair protein RadA n=1 Tax=Kineococcus indalonis TaxID=2696566 RepID=UPI001412BD9F
MPARTRTLYRCTACGQEHAKWIGRCTGCQAWGTVEEAAAEPARSAGTRTSLAPSAVVTKALRVRDISTDRARHRPTGIGELDRVLGGGLVPGAAVLLGGEPGVGKSTLTLDVANRIAATGRTVLVVSGEESAEQIKIRAQRMGADAAELFIASETDLSVVLGHVDDVQPDLLVVDSVQTIASPDVEGRTGGVAQVTEVATVLTRLTKARGIPMFLIGQVTKDGNIAGPRTVEHLVDVVLHFEGDKHSPLRMLRGVKNRYGASDEVACFVQEADGIREVTDPSGLFLGQREAPVPGTCVTVVVEGKRPLLAEIQALVAQSYLPQPRRGASGLDAARLAMTQAVVERHGRVRLYDKDVFCATVGGMRIGEPSADLAVALAIASASTDQPLAADVVALGEVALSGDIRPVPDIARRLAEAGRRGFRQALVPAGTRDKLGAQADSLGLVLVEVDSVARAVEAVAAVRPAREGREAPEGAPGARDGAPGARRGRPG